MAQSNQQFQNQNNSNGLGSAQPLLHAQRLPGAESEMSVFSTNNNNINYSE